MSFTLAHVHAVSCPYPAFQIRKEVKAMNDQNDRQAEERLIIEAVDVGGIDVLEEDIAALSASNSCCGCGCAC